MNKNKYYEETPNANNEYINERDLRVEQFKYDEEFINLSKKWRENALMRKYMNNFSWMGRPLIQFPGDIIAVQEC
jgi:cephalosporin hydroxylase